MYVIYALIDPRDDSVHYVGMTDNVYQRFLAHIQGSGNNYEKNKWVHEMRSSNAVIQMKHLEETEDIGYARVRELYWINHYKSLHHPITNVVTAPPKLRSKVLVRSARVKSPKVAIQSVEDRIAAKAAQGVKRVVERAGVAKSESGIPEMLRNEIAERYASGMGRVAIRDDLELNGDQYWMIRVVCDECDRKQKVKEV